MSTSKEILKSLQKDKKAIQHAKGPFGYTCRQRLDLINVNDKIREIKRIT